MAVGLQKAGRLKIYKPNENEGLLHEEAFVQ